MPQDSPQAARQDPSVVPILEPPALGWMPRRPCYSYALALVSRPRLSRARGFHLGWNVATRPFRERQGRDPFEDAQVELFVAEQTRSSRNAGSVSTAEIRKWALANGYAVSSRGALPEEVKAAYAAAH